MHLVSTVQVIFIKIYTKIY